MVQGAGCHMGLHSGSVHCTQLASEGGEGLGEVMRTPRHPSGLETVSKSWSRFLHSKDANCQGTRRGVGLRTLVFTAQQPGAKGDRERHRHLERHGATGKPPEIWV